MRSILKQNPIALRWLSNPRLLMVYTLSLVFGFTALAHENNLAASASLLAGDSITQYAIIIGLTLAGMAVGFKISGWVSQKIMKEAFLSSEVVLTLISGFSIVICLWVYSTFEGYIWVLRSVAFLISTLVGIEDALLLRVAEEEEQNLQQSVSLMFWFSNMGGAVAGFTFGQWLVPSLGVFNLAIVLGLVDGLLVVAALLHFKREIKGKSVLLVAILATMTGLFLALLSGQSLEKALTQALYNDPVRSEWISPYGQKVLTQDRLGNHKLFINGQLQFSSKDEYQYHELLIHPAMSVAANRVKNRPLSVMIAGGGDGLAAREILKYSQVGQIIVVDLDPQMTNEVAVQEPIVSYNQGSFLNPKVTVINKDAYIWLRDENAELFDVIIVDLVDPDSEATAKLYSVEFYQMLSEKSLAKGGVVVTQSTSPWYSAKAFWTIHLSMGRAFAQVVPYRWAIPSFGDWGWQLASTIPFDEQAIAIESEHTRWLNTEGWKASLFFGKDELQMRDDLESKKVVSTLMNPAVMYYYQQSVNWDDWDE
jgi:spermidine synthase